MFYDPTPLLVANGLAVFNLVVWGVVFWKISLL